MRINAQMEGDLYDEPSVDARAIMAAFEALRWPRCASAAVAAHIAQLGDDPRPYPGLRADCGDRLHDWCSMNSHQDKTKLETQLKFLSHELSGSRFASLGNRLALATDVEEATVIFASYVAPGTTLPDLHERIMAAKALLSNGD
jgi:hypothetical protein